MTISMKYITLPDPPHFYDIPQFTRLSNYSVHVAWTYLEKWITDIGIPIELDPDFQRAHVWNKTQQTRYIEYILRGGISSRDIYWNCKGWGKNFDLTNPIQLVDGKQRIKAVSDFLNNKVKAFDHLFCDYIDYLSLIGPRFVFHVNNLESRAEVLQWYLDLNSGGVVHSEKELNRVRQLLEEELSNNCCEK